MSAHDSRVETDLRHYAVGYLPGAFDLFHIGHLNIIRAARPYCDRLIVGVVPDESVLRVKGHTPFIPLAERMELVRHIRLVDEVVEDDSKDKVEMWHKLHFDVIFKGSDWKGTPKGYALEAGMASVGADVVYFQYTEQTSSTQLRSALSKLA